MELIQIKTLIDITNTRVIRERNGTPLAFNQNKNFITLIQCLEIRSIISYDSPPLVEKIDIKSMEFGSIYKGKHNVWTFKFSPDRMYVYEHLGNPIGGLIDDLHEIPIIKTLTETINIDKSIFDSKDETYKNIIIQAF